MNIAAIKTSVDSSDLYFALMLFVTYLASTVSGSFMITTMVQSLLIFYALFYRPGTVVAAKCMLVSFFMGVEVVFLIFTVLYALSSLMHNKNTFLYVRNKVLLLLFLYSIFVFVANMFYQFTIVNYVLWISVFFAPYCAYFYAQELSSNDVGIKDIYALSILLVIVQCIILLFLGISETGFSPGDWAAGTFGDAHKLGFLYLFFGVLVGYSFLKERSFVYLVLLCFMTFFLYLCDAKAIVLSAFLAVILASVFSLFFAGKWQAIVYRPLSFFVLTIFILVFSVVGIPSQVAEFFEIYLYGELSSSKYRLYVSVWNEMLFDSPFNWLFGVGPGELGSRASNMLSGDVLWKKEGGLATLLPVFSSAWTREYMDGLVTSEVMKYIGNVSAILTYPYAGFISIKAELGLLGLFIFSYCLFTILYRSVARVERPIDKTLLLMGVVIFCSLLFDNYHEQMSVLGLYMFILGLNRTETGVGDESFSRN